MLTHYYRHDAPDAAHKHVRAVCGQMIDRRREFGAEPSCPTCAQWVREFEAMDLGETMSERSAR